MLPDPSARAACSPQAASSPPSVRWNTEFQPRPYRMRTLVICIHNVGLGLPLTSFRVHFGKQLHSAGRSRHRSDSARA